MTLATLQFFQDGGAATGHDVFSAALRLTIAAVLGGVVALLYRASRDPDARSPGFSHTPVMLSPLITMVTMAIG